MITHNHGHYTATLRALGERFDDAMVYYGLDVISFNLKRDGVKAAFQLAVPHKLRCDLLDRCEAQQFVWPFTEPRPPKLRLFDDVFAVMTDVSLSNTGL